MAETPSPTRRQRSARGQGDELREALLAAAESLLVEPRAASPLSLREVARLAGVSPTAVYLHFASANELIAAVVDLEGRRLVEAVLGADAASDAVEPAASVTLADIATRYVEWGLANPGAYQLLFESADRLGNPVGPADAGWAVLDAAADALHRARGRAEAGTGAADASTGTADDEARRDVMRAWAALHGIVSLRIHKGDAIWPTSAQEDALAAIMPLGA